MRNIKVILEYEGTNYLGWQRQPQGMTVQQAMEEALLQITGHMPHVQSASRTDAGVHARGQVANFKTESLLPIERFHGALNAVLPRDIAVLACEEVPLDFNSRFSARSKRYHYRVWNQRVRPAIERHVVWHVRWAAELAPMQEAARLILGTHDFIAFQARNAQSETTVRTVHHADWQQADSLFTFSIEADAFLYNMVRTLAGSMIDIGRGKLPMEQFRRALDQGDRQAAGRTAPPQGLCLMAVNYPPIPPLPGDIPAPAAS